MINLGSAYGTIEIGTSGAQQSVQSLASSLRSVGTTMSLAISGPLLAVGASAISSAADFERSMNVLQSVSNATGEQMQALQAQALQLGADTSFSAGEAAKGMLELAKADMDAEQTGQAIGGVMSLAAAGNLGLAQAAEIAANALNAFNLPASDANRVADLLAAAANSSSVEVTDMAQSFQMASAVFSSSNQLIEDLSTAIAILGNNGLKGSDAGTSLKTMMMRLTAPTKETASLMQQLGINVYDASGKTRAFPDILADLQRSLGGMSDEQRNAAGATLFGADAIRAANILLKEGTGEYDSMKNAVTEQGAAANAAGANMKGFWGAIERVKGSIDSFYIDTLLPWLDSMSGLLLVVEDAVNWLGRLPQPVKDAALAFAAALAAAGPFLLALSYIGTVLGVLLSPIGLITLAVAGLAAAWVADWGGIREATFAAWATIQPLLMSVWGWLQVSLVSALATLKGWWNTTWPMLANIATVAWATISGAVNTAWATIQPYLTLLWGWLQINIPLALTTTQNWFNAVWAAIPGALSTAWAALSQTFSLVYTWLQTYIPIALTYLQAVWSTAWGAISPTISAAWSAIQPILNSVYTWLQTYIPLAIGTLQTWWNTTWPQIQSSVATAWAAIGPTFNLVYTWLQTYIPLAISTLQTWWNTAWATISPAVSTAWGVIQPILNTVYTWLQNNIPTSLGELQAIWSTAWATISSAVDTAWATAQTAFNSIYNFVTVTIPAGIAYLQTTWDSIWASISATTTTSTSAITTIWNALVAIFGPSIENLKASFAGMLTGFSAMGPQFAALWVAVQPVIEQLKMGVMVLGSIVANILGGTVIVAINALASAFQNLPALVSVVVAQIINVLNFISSMVSNVTAMVRAIIDGDWSAAWSSAQAIVNGLVTFIQGTLANSLSFVGVLIQFVGDTIAGILSSLGFENAAASVEAFTSKIVGLVAWLAKLVKGDVQVNLAAPPWMLSLLDWAWPVIGPAVDWVSSLLSWAWPAMAATAEAWVSELMSWGWPDFISQPGWVGSLFDWEWPDFISQPTWLSTLLDWSWPDIPIPSWLGGGDGNAGGTSYGLGQWSALNERGRELVSIPSDQGILPPGSRVYTNGQSNRMMGATDGGVTINMSGITIMNDMDIHEMADKLGRLLRRK